MAWQTTIDSWKLLREDAIARQIEEKEEIARWARRILEGIEGARHYGKFDPNSYEGDEGEGTGPQPVHAADWHAICDAIDLLSWSCPTTTGKLFRPDCWDEAVKLARAAWEDEAQARARSTTES